MRLPLPVFLFILLCFTAAQAGEVVTPSRVLSGEEIELEDGRILRLSGIKGASPEAAAFLEAHVRGKNLNLKDEVRDRYGRFVAKAFVEGETPCVQEALLREGWAFLYCVPENQCPDAWANIEREARLDKKGFWATHADTPAEEAIGRIGAYGFVTGVAAKAERVKNKVYVTLGNGGPSDFKVIIAAKYIRIFKKQGIDLLALQGQKLRVRGWITRASGPAITISDRHQLEVER